MWFHSRIGTSRFLLAGTWLLLWLAIARPTYSQVRRLPPVESPGNRFQLPGGLQNAEAIRAAQTVSDWQARSQKGIPESLATATTPPDSPPPRPELAKFKPGMLQRISLTAAWLPSFQNNDLGVTELTISSTIGIPFPKRESPLLVTPGYGLTLLDDPRGSQLPEKLHEAYTTFRWLRKFNERWGAEVAVSPSVFSDFEAWHDDALRITGRAFAAYTWSATTQVIFGVVYLDREDVGLLPGAGLIWTPNEDLRYELIFPRPRIARLVGYGPAYEDWLFLAAEFGGGSWSVETPAGTPDLLTIRDYRAIIGIERKRDGGGGGRLELGWVFGREVEFRSGVGNFEPDATLMFRGGLTY